jgi:hypothetical protein
LLHCKISNSKDLCNILSSFLLKDSEKWILFEVSKKGIKLSIQGASKTTKIASFLKTEFFNEFKINTDTVNIFFFILELFILYIFAKHH